MNRQRKARKGKGCGLNEERSARLEALGFVWGTLGAVQSPKAPAVENFAWVPVGLAPTKSARGSVSLI